MVSGSSVGLLLATVIAAFQREPEADQGGALVAASWPQFGPRLSAARGEIRPSAPGSVRSPRYVRVELVHPVAHREDIRGREYSAASQRTSLLPVGQTQFRPIKEQTDHPPNA